MKLLLTSIVLAASAAMAVSGTASAAVVCNILTNGRTDSSAKYTLTDASVSIESGDASGSVVFQFANLKSTDASAVELDGYGFSASETRFSGRYGTTQFLQNVTRLDLFGNDIYWETNEAQMNGQFSYTVHVDKMTGTLNLNESEKDCSSTGGICWPHKYVEKIAIQMQCPLPIPNF